MKPNSSGGITRGHWLAILAAFLGWMFDGFEMGIYPLVARPAVREMLREPVTNELQTELAGLSNEEARKKVDSALEPRVGTWNSIYTAVFLFGAAGGGLVFGWLGDRIGRTQAMIYSVLTYALFTGLAGFATQPWHLAVARVLAALGMGGEWSLGVALIMELWPAKARPLLAGMIGAASNVGFLLIAVISLVLGQFIREQEGSWRPLLFVGVAPAFLTLFIRLFVPESEKWKHAVADAPKPRPWEIFVPGLWQRTLLAIALCAVALIATWGAVQWQVLWVEKMVEQTKEVKVSTAKGLTQMVSAFGACIGTLLAALLAGRFGRKIVYFLLCAISLPCALWFFRPPWLLEPFGLLSEATPRFGFPFLLQALVVGAVTASFYGWIPLYLPELFPTRVRATGQGLSFNFGRIFAALGNLFGTGPLLGHFEHYAKATPGGDYASAMAAVTMIYLLGMVLIWFAPETHGKPLPD